MITGESPRPAACAWIHRAILPAALSIMASASVLAQEPQVKELKPLQPIDVPQDSPPVAAKDPFDEKDRWLEPITITAPKQKIKAPVIIGDRMKKKWPTLVVAPGSVWSGTNRGRIELSGGSVVARKSRFERLPIEVDHACRYFFINCTFDECRFGKGGVWYGGDLAGKYFFEDCIIRKTFANPINLVDTGFRIQTCVFENIDLPSMNFRKKEAADYVNEKWLRVIHCRFVKCTIPLSFLLLTRECVFENCTFIEDKAEGNDFKKLIEVDLYVKNSKSKIEAYPANVILHEKSDTKLEGVEIPTVASLQAAMAK